MLYEVITRFYDLDAATPAQLTRSILRQAPVGQPGRRAVGRAIYKVAWQLDTSQRKGACYLFGVKVKTQVDVLVPNWLQLSNRITSYNVCYTKLLRH